MKKKIIILLILIALFSVILYFQLRIPNSGIMICNYSDNSDNVSISTKYTITYENMYVTKLITVEKVVSDDDNLLLEYRDNLKSMYSLYNDIKYYDNSVKLKNDTVTSITEINYKKIDTNKLIELDTSNKYLINNGKINIKDIKKIYSNNGAKCKIK